MIEMDEWGRDPSVQAIRKIFKEMETCKNEILGRLGISPYDLRIRRWLEKALAIFEKAWEAANQMGIFSLRVVWGSGAPRPMKKVPSYPLSLGSGEVVVYEQRENG
jgi:hypothetical protein